MSLQCILCDHQNDIELVSHINKVHGGLRMYMLFFPFTKVVVSNLYTAIENTVYFRSSVNSEPGIERITNEDRQLIVETSMSQMGPRSEIYVESDF
jgi:hypothetical protein